MKSINRKKSIPKVTIAVVLSLSIGMQAGLSTSWAESSQNSSTFAKEFKNPVMEVRPKMRWWMPGAYMDNDEIKREIKGLADAGYGGAEVLFFFPIPTADADPKKDYSFGSEEWNDRMKAALEAAVEHDFTLDFTLTPSWPLAIPSITDVNDKRNEQGLHIGVTAPVQGTYHGAIPEPKTLTSSRNKKLVTVTASRVDQSISVGKKLTLSEDSTIVLKQGQDYDPVNNTISWTPPADGEWRLFSYWSQTTGHLNNSTGTPVINHFSKESMKAITDYWDENLMKDPELVKLYKKNAGSIFVDSLELTSTIGEEGLYGTPPEAVAMWEPHLLEEFKKRRGYDLTPYLPSIFVKGLYQYSGGHNKYDEPSEYDFASADIGYRIRNDFLKTLTEMHQENNLEPLKSWAKSYNMTIRTQGVYQTPMEVTSTSLVPDITETESWNSGDNIDVYRLQSGAAHMAGKIYSAETAARPGLGYTQTWSGSNAVDNQGLPDKGMLWHINRLYAGGVNQHVLHGMSYETQSVPEMYKNWFFNWPGFSIMANSFSNEWGERQPYWVHTSQMAGYIARNNEVLQRGQAKVDVAVFRDRYNESGVSAEAGSSSLEKAGYSYDFVSAGLLDLDNATVSNKGGISTLAADGPAYKALVINSRKNTSDNKQMAADMSVETAEKIYKFAKSGLPVVIVGELPKHAISFKGSEAKMREEDRLLKERLTALRNLPTVKQVASKEEVPSALSRLEVIPAARPSSSSNLLSVRRADKETNYYYLYNQSTTDKLDDTVSLKGEGIPYMLDTWSGEITPIAQYKVEGDRISTRVKLAPNSTTIIVLGNNSWGKKDIKTNIHVLETDADSAVYNRKGKLAVRYSKEGKGTTKLSDGSTVRHAFSKVPEAFSLSSWHLALESWTPGETPILPKKTVIQRDVKELKPWSEIEGLENVSGIGTYSASFTLGSDWTEHTGAYLNVGKVGDTFTMKVNGQEVPPIDQTSRIADIGSYLKAGKNTIEIKIATPLNNAMRVKSPSRQQQDYGLIGPVEVLPYKEEVINIEKRGIGNSK